MIIRNKEPHMCILLIVAIFSICHFGTPFACSGVILNNHDKEQLTELNRSGSLGRAFSWERLGATGSARQRLGGPGSAQERPWSAFIRTLLFFRVVWTTFVEPKWTHVGIKMMLKMGCSEKAEKSKIS